MVNAGHAAGLVVFTVNETARDYGLCPPRSTAKRQGIDCHARRKGHRHHSARHKRRQLNDMIQARPVKHHVIGRVDIGTTGF